MSAPTHAAASGVEALIHRLQEEGISRGQAEADKLLAAAQAQAHSLLAQAEAEAQALREKTHQETETSRRASQEALQVAFRDTVLTLKNWLLQRFSGDVERLVSAEMSDREFLQRLILEVAGRVRERHDLDSEAGGIELLIPEEAVEVEELRRHPEELRVGTLSHFVLARAGSLLREGVSLQVSPDVAAGIRIRLVDRDIEIDLTDATVAALLLQHLQPRFRAFLEGMVR
jgi:V/A-type H+/Na+-transporting ATPase subunit E